MCDRKLQPLFKSMRVTNDADGIQRWVWEFMHDCPGMMPPKKFEMVCDNPESSGWQCDTCSDGTCKNCGECLGQHPIYAPKKTPV